MQEHSSTVVPFNYHPSVPLLLHFILCFVSTKICRTVAAVDSGVACALNEDTSAPLFKVSPWVLKLWQWRTPQAFSHLHPSRTSPNAPHPDPHFVKISPALPQWETEGKRDLEERGESTTTTAASKSQQPGEGEWVIFYGRWGTVNVHLFISTVSTGVCLCVYMSVCICVCVCVWDKIRHYSFFSYQKRPEVTSPPFQAPSCNAAAICVANAKKISIYLGQRL